METSETEYEQNSKRKRTAKSLGNLLRVSVTCTNKHKCCCYLPFLYLWFTMSCTVSMVGNATYFLAFLLRATLP